MCESFDADDDGDVDCTVYTFYSDLLICELYEDCDEVSDEFCGDDCVTGDFECDDDGGDDDDGETARSLSYINSELEQCLRRLHSGHDRGRIQLRREVECR